MQVITSSSSIKEADRRNRRSSVMDTDRCQGNTSQAMGSMKRSHRQASTGMMGTMCKHSNRVVATRGMECPHLLFREGIMRLAGIRSVILVVATVMITKIWERVW